MSNQEEISFQQLLVLVMKIFNVRRTNHFQCGVRIALFWRSWSELYTVTLRILFAKSVCIASCILVVLDRFSPV